MLIEIINFTNICIDDIISIIDKQNNFRGD